MLKIILTISMITTFHPLFAGSWKDKFVKVPELQESHYEITNAEEGFLNPKKINVLVWNMFKAKNKSWKSDFKKLSQNSDIQVMQELTSKNGMVDTFKDLNLDFDMAISFIFTLTGSYTGVATSAVAPAMESQLLRSNYIELGIATPKMVLINKYPIQGSSKELLVANIHAVNFVPTHALTQQLVEVALVIKDHNGPAIFAGDFNTWSKGKTDKMYEVLESVGLTDVKFENDQRMMKFGFALDHIFYKGLKLIESDTLGDVEGADHIPMVASFSFLKSD